MKNILIALVSITFLFSCKSSNERFTESGFRYLLHIDSSGVKPKKGDYVTIDLVCHTEDSVLIDTRKTGSPYRFRLESIPFSGSYEECLTNIGVGDSATFFVSADSLFEYLFRKTGNDSILQEETLLKKGSVVMYDVRMIKVQDYVAAEQEMQMQFSRMEKEEKRILQEFISRNKIDAKPDANGIYLVKGKSSTSKGLPSDSGMVMSVFFRGRLMDGSVFNTTKANEPFNFTLGSGEVIKGWDNSLKGIRAGERVTLIIPSSQAYGEEGLLNTSTGKFMVPPYSTVIFDVVVAGVALPTVAEKQ